MKILAIILAALSLVTAFFGALGIIYLAQHGLYTGTIESYANSRREQKASEIAPMLLLRYAAKELGQCSADTLSYIGQNYTDEDLSRWYNIDPEAWDYSIADAAGNYVETTYTGALQRSDVVTYSSTLSCDYPREVTADELEANGAVGSGYYATDAQGYYTVGDQEYFLYYYPSGEYTVTIRMLPFETVDNSDLTFDMIFKLYELRYAIVGFFFAGLITFILCAVYLCCAAGRSSDGSALNPRGLNRLPLDLYLAITTGWIILCAWLAIELMEQIFWTDTTATNWVILMLSGAVLWAAALLGVAFCFAAAAQFKMGAGYWWKHTVIGKILRFCYRCCRALFRLLPLIWQWLLIGAAMGISSLFFLLLAANGSGFWLLPLLLSLLTNIAIICYGAYAFGVLQKGAKRMAEGDLNTKIDTRYLLGAFRDHAERLNALSDASMVAARNLMKSERMKTELITNVSHDIKTPLTSIINYVDLLEKPHTEEEGVQYLDVLSRQSQRLKKLVEDLMEMSKASTGNISTNIETMDLTETVNQALGEFADKLTLAELTPVFRQPEQPVLVEADGRLTWRVLSNLFSNIVKYALPGTRVYMDITRFQNNVLLSLKNISREELNVDAEELTERFVRGDTSRNTEGSGLGLNIAKSLMELQKGKLNLVVDGDLFKVTLTFPAQ